MKKILPFHIENFTYNGFFVSSRPGIAKYTVTFMKWTQDPGIFEGRCSDGYVRNIPECCIVNRKSIKLPEQHYRNKVLVGSPSTSGKPGPRFIKKNS